MKELPHVMIELPPTIIPKENLTFSTHDSRDWKRVARLRHLIGARQLVNIFPLQILSIMRIKHH